MDPAFIMYLDVALAALMTDGERVWRGEVLGKLCDLKGAFQTDCANIALIQKMERIFKLSDQIKASKTKTNFKTSSFS